MSAMKRFWQILVVVVFLVAWVWYSIRQDKLDLLMYHAAELRSAMVDTYQLQAKGAMLAKSADGACWLAISEMDKSIAQYTQGEDALLHTDLLPIRQLTQVIKNNNHVSFVLTAANMPNAHKGYRFNITRLVDYDDKDKRMILEVKPQGELKKCPRKIWQRPSFFIALKDH